MACANSPQMNVTFYVLKRGRGYASLAEGVNITLKCLTCGNRQTQILMDEDDVLRHMGRKHRNRNAQYWMMRDNVYTNSFTDYCNMMDPILEN